MYGFICAVLNEYFNQIRYSKGIPTVYINHLTFLTMGSTYGFPSSVAYMPMAMLTLLGLGSALHASDRPKVMSIGARVRLDHRELQ